MAGADAIVDDAALEPLVARSDMADRLISADVPLARLQRACGGEIPGLIAAPDLLELVRKARGFGMRLGRPLAMRHAQGRLEGWAEVVPDAEGCTIRLSDWHAIESEAAPTSLPDEETRLAVENLLAEAMIWLDEGQRVLACETQAPDLAVLSQRVIGHRGAHWTTLFDFGNSDDVPAVWQARRGAKLAIEGSTRPWHLLLTSGSGGFRLLLRPLADFGEDEDGEADLLPPNLLRDELGPAMHGPVRRIIRQAEAIRDRMAGPLPREYREYAQDIVRAGKHLRELADELGDAEAIEHGIMEIAVEPVRISEIVDSACRILQGRADARRITLMAEQTALVAMVDRRRTLQILLNIVGNAIDYGPADSTVSVTTGQIGDMAELRVEDEGHALSPEDRIRIFDKFERLGRSGDSGSGLGLYIALMLARAMGGTVEAQAAEGGGNSFRITLPLA
ncbi:HAMP domain-containing sensor histidine kinase [Croceicoccus sp. BE223]|uniref:sensor histidine kinase n=1 Tax=Croceicoccus sp. BE223 TaxID=2817716 RepID=UPI00285DABEC|nr:HAMP domain-containing sensor histidine kinase [Croceicoccus sp. BE223]MDR7103352.1 signal transduction histidine kinase [Croceicoccus sp. BE223]